MSARSPLGAEMDTSRQVSDVAGQGRLGDCKPAIKSLPLRVSEFAGASAGGARIELRQGQVRIEGNADAALVRVLQEYLRE